MARTDYGSHAYWRVHCLQLNFVAFSAFLFKDDTGSAIATTGGTALESDHWSSFSSSNLFDSNNSTFWESGNAPGQWAGYHFSSAKKVMQIALQKTASMDGSVPPVAVMFQYSDDGITWGTAGFAIVGTLTNDVPTYFDLAGSL